MLVLALASVLACRAPEPRPEPLFPWLPTLGVVAESGSVVFLLEWRWPVAKPHFWVGERPRRESVVESVPAQLPREVVHLIDADEMAAAKRVQQCR
jgi:hypothetical protein